MDLAEKYNTQGGYPHPAPPPAYPGGPQPSMGQPQPQPHNAPYMGHSVYPPQPTTVIQPGSGVTVIQPGVAGGSTFVSGGATTVIVARDLGTQPTRLQCSTCYADIVTRTTSKPSLRTHLVAAILCFVGCWPCVCIPYCMDSCMLTEHNCPNCGTYLGSSN